MAYVVERECLALSGVVFPRGTVLARKWEWRLRGLLPRWVRRGWLAKTPAETPEEQVGVVTASAYAAATEAPTAPATPAAPAAEPEAADAAPEAPGARRDAAGHLMGKRDLRAAGSPCIH